MSELLVEVIDSIQVVTFNRPQARNAMTFEVATLMCAAMDELDRNDALRACIVTGTGGTFCSGMDLKDFLAGKRPSVPGRGFAGVTERPPTKPMIAAVEGYALAGGFEVVLSCDLVVASTTAKFGLPEVKRGLVATAGGLLRLPSRIPRPIAMEYILTGDMMTAQTAYQYGLVNQLVEPGQTLEAAMALARRIVVNGPMALIASKRVVTESDDWSRAEMFARQLEIAQPVFDSDDAKEGSRAFAEKRPARWSGH
ncbi:crotonase/enoyl-CoA hydratase family protein [soil metagenome]